MLDVTQVVNLHSEESLGHGCHGRSEAAESDLSRVCPTTSRGVIRPISAPATAATPSSYRLISATICGGLASGGNPDITFSTIRSLKRSFMNARRRVRKYSDRQNRYVVSTARGSGAVTQILTSACRKRSSAAAAVDAPRLTST